MAVMYWLLGAAGAVAVVVVLCTGAYWHFGWLLAADRVPKGLYSDPQQPGTVRFVCVSDTHNKHKYLDVPPGDVLVCSGDFTRRGTPKEIKAFNKWLGTLPHKHKVIVAGNHDLLFDHKFYEANWESWTKHKAQCGPGRAAALLTNATHYVEHEQIVVEGVKLFGSPYQPEIGPRRRMAFNTVRGAPETAALWAKVPQDTQVLVTHGPPMGHLDRVFLGKRVGCEALAEAVKRVKPQFHVFGHIHESYGVEVADGTTFINAACVTVRYKAASARPVVFDVTPNVS